MFHCDRNVLVGLVFLQFLHQPGEVQRDPRAAVDGLLERGALSPPDEVFYGFGEAQEKLNKLLTERATLKETVDGGTRIALDLTRLVQELKKYKTD